MPSEILVDPGEELGVTVTRPERRNATCSGQVTAESSSIRPIATVPVVLMGTTTNSSLCIRVRSDQNWPT
jgi:hypothetical protein